MRRYDKTGPFGTGAPTGWGRCWCVEKDFSGPGANAEFLGIASRWGGLGGSFSGFREWWRYFWGQSVKSPEEVLSLEETLTGGGAEMETGLAELKKTD